MVRTSIALGALLALLSAGCAVPEPLGATRATAHYEVRTDAPGERFAEAVARDAERAHLALSRAYGGAPEGSFPLVVYRERRSFDEQLSPALRDRGFVGECGERFALIYWPDDVRGRDTLAPELVHRFNAALLPALPYWIDEGLAKALAPKRVHGDWLGAVAELPDDELRARIRSLPSLPDGDDYALRCLVAAALVRHGLETGRFDTVTAITGWKPDVDRFLAWLRERRAPLSEKKFAPVWSSSLAPG